MQKILSDITAEHIDAVSKEDEESIFRVFASFRDVAEIMASELADGREPTDAECQLARESLHRARDAAADVEAALFGKDALDATIETSEAYERFFPELTEDVALLVTRLSQKKKELARGRKPESAKTGEATIRNAEEVEKIVVPSDEYEMFPCRSGGKGGQNVNKVETKVFLRFRIGGSVYFNDAEKAAIRENCPVTDKDEIVMYAQEERFQRRNRELVIEKLHRMLKDALRVRAPRIPTKPTESSQRKRIEQKRLFGKKKAERRNRAEAE